MPIYEVGMGSDVRKVEAPDAAMAAMFYGIYLINTNNPFMTVVYTENGQPWEGDAWWINPNADEDHVKMVADRIGRDFVDKCRFHKPKFYLYIFDDTITTGPEDNLVGRTPQELEQKLAQWCREEWEQVNHDDNYEPEILSDEDAIAIAEYDELMGAPGNYAEVYVPEEWLSAEFFKRDSEDLPQITSMDDLTGGAFVDNPQD